jgi:hypothetical protein
MTFEKEIRPGMTNKIASSFASAKQRKQLPK